MKNKLKKYKNQRKSKLMLLNKRKTRQNKVKQKMMVRESPWSLRCRNRTNNLMKRQMALKILAHLATLVSNLERKKMNKRLKKTIKKMKIIKVLKMEPGATSADLLKTKATMMVLTTMVITNLAHLEISKKKPMLQRKILINSQRKNKSRTRN